MVDTRNMAASLSKQAGILVPEQAVSNAKLQDIVGVAEDALSIFAQTSPPPGVGEIDNPLSPIHGDQIFFTYLWVGARFQSHDGQWWEIDEYDGWGKIGLHNVWYPRMQAIVSVADVRRSIYAWIEPIQQVVPPAPAGVVYGS
jgi:hypothetical protein